jgi:hypothetical protein
MTSFRNFFSFRTASNIILVLNTAVIVFHIFVLLQIFPLNVVWAGRLKSVEEMFVFESVSIVINLILIGIVWRKVILVRQKKRNRVIDALLWFFTLLFALNTAGNLTSTTSVEKFIATPLTFILAVCCLRLSIESPNISASRLDRK